MNPRNPKRMKFVGRRPVLLHNGQPVPQAAYCDYILRRDWEDRIREFVDSGVRVFYLRFSRLEDLAFWGIPRDEWPETGELPLEIARQAEVILNLQPDARFYIRPNATPPQLWLDKHPEDAQTDEDGKRYRDAVWASPLYLEAMRNWIRNSVRHCESQSWGERIVGYLEASSGEGTTPLTIAGKMFDCSPASEDGFRRWVRERYGDEQALQAAWNDSGLTFDSVRVPRDREWHEKKAGLPPTIQGQPVQVRSLPSNAGRLDKGLFHWLETGPLCREHDYCRFMRDALRRKTLTLARTVRETAAEFGRERLVGFDITKAPLMGWQILSSFDGIGDGQTFPNIMLLSGSWDVAGLLDEEDVDVIFNPADYHARTLGCAFESEGVADSMIIRGKASIVENDQRNYVGEGIQDQGAFRNDREVEAGLIRNAAFTLSRGLQSYWCNVGSSYFHAPGIQRTVARLAAMLERLNEHPHRETRDAIAMVVDDESLLVEDFTSGYQTLSVIWQRILGLAHCGVPYRLYLLSDLEKDNLPAYKTWLFPNLFVVNGRVERLLREKVLRDGNLAIFGPATGISDGQRLGVRGAEAILGVPMELHPRTTVRHVIVWDNGHPISRELPASFTYGDSLPYGPTMTPREWAVENAGGIPLGHATACWFINRTGLFLKEFGRGASGNGRAGKRTEDDFAVLWSEAMPLPSALLRAACRYAGCHIWCEEDDVVYASDSFVGLHSVKAGTRTLRLPRPCTVRDALTQETLGEGLNELTLDIDPPQTRVFVLD